MMQNTRTFSLLVLVLELEKVDRMYVAYVPDKLRVGMNSNETSDSTIFWIFG